ncbi:MAG: hypothetical protein ABL890_04645 [Candidatus Peribacteraceae bacterium]
MTSKQWTAIGVLIAGLTAATPFFLKSANIDAELISGSAVAVDSQVGQMQVINNYGNAPNPSFENSRSSDLSRLEGKDLIQAWFDRVNEGQWKDACSLMAKDKCDVTNGDNVLDHSREPRLKAVNGYQDVNIWHAENAPKDLWCVKYKYQERQSVVSRDIVLIMQYKLSPRSDDGQDIASRLCEKNWMQGLGDRPCSVAASTHFCT